MPNHLHGIVFITDSNVGVTGRSPLPKGPTPKSIGSFIGGFKSSVTKRINAMLATPGIPIWQRNYYERIIRIKNELMEIMEYMEYIVNNPRLWEEDANDPIN